MRVMVLSRLRPGGCHRRYGRKEPRRNHSMSAWIVEKLHIDCMVTMILRSEVVDTKGQTPDQIGAQLWEENYRSVNYRYREDEKAPEYQYQRFEIPTVDVPGHAYLWLLKQVNCYDYQTCEHPQYRDGDTYLRLIKPLENLFNEQAEREYPGWTSPEYAVRSAAQSQSKVYNNAPWGVG